MICKGRLVVLLLLLMLSPYLQAQRGWTREQLSQAATCDSVPGLRDTERDAVRYINLCRLFPADFARIELGAYRMDPAYGISVIKEFNRNKISLINDLNLRKPCGALEFDEELYKDAQCYSKEISNSFRKPHERKNCPANSYAECLTFGSFSGKEIAIQLLVDAGVRSLGHRKICLDPDYQYIGVSTGKHYKYGSCAVLEFDYAYEGDE